MPSAREIPELAKYIRQFDYVVAQDGSGDFFTVQEAINAVPDFRKDVRTTILIRKGTYKEKLIIPESKINISLIGEDGAILTYDGFANKKNVFGENMGTSRFVQLLHLCPRFLCGEYHIRELIRSRRTSSCLFRICRSCLF